MRVAFFRLQRYRYESFYRIGDWIYGHSVSYNYCDSCRWTFEAHYPWSFYHLKGKCMLNKKPISNEKVTVWLVNASTCLAIIVVVVIILLVVLKSTGFLKYPWGLKDTILKKSPLSRGLFYYSEHGLVTIQIHDITHTFFSFTKARFQMDHSRCDSDHRTYFFAHWLSNVVMWTFIIFAAILINVVAMIIIFADRPHSAQTTYDARTYCNRNHYEEAYIIWPLRSSDTEPVRFYCHKYANDQNVEGIK